MKAIKWLFLPVVATLFLSGCTITHKYGPYMGKVVDTETNMPIEGAVVFLVFMTEYPTLGGPVSSYADALEVLTDKDGEFKIPSYRIWALRPISRWNPTPRTIIVFKPGYGAFPGHKNSAISKWKEYEQYNHGIPEDEPFIIKLPRLKTREERGENVLRHLWPGSGTPKEKHPVLERLKEQEKNQIGY